MDHKHYLIPPGKKVKLKDHDPAFTAHWKFKKEAAAQQAKDIALLENYQGMLFAQRTHGMVVILQGMDTAGKDGVIRHVMRGANPQGTHVHSFRAPAGEEADHDYLWRSTKALPEQGGIAIFNRSYFEEVLVVRVRPELLQRQHLPTAVKNNKDIWQQRFDQINAYEKYLVSNGIIVLKFFLHISKQEQKGRLIHRIRTADKNWKFSVNDMEQREHWDAHLIAYEDAISHTSSKHAPWYVVPADHKWFTRAVVTDVIVEKLKSLGLKYPAANKEHKTLLRTALLKLQQEGKKMEKVKNVEKVKKEEKVKKKLEPEMA